MSAAPASVTASKNSDTATEWYSHEIRSPGTLPPSGNDERGLLFLAVAQEQHLDFIAALVFDVEIILRHARVVVFPVAVEGHDDVVVAETGILESPLEGTSLDVGILVSEQADRQVVALGEPGVSPRPPL